MSRLMRPPLFAIVVLLLTVARPIFVPAKEPAEQQSELKSLLMRPVLTDGQSLAEVKKFCDRRIAEMPHPVSWSSWQREAERIRQNVLDNIVFRGVPPKWRDESRRVCHQKIARGAMIPFAFHPIGGHVFSEPKEGLSLLIVVKRFMREDRFRMEIGRVAALLDIDRPIVVGNGDDSSVVISSDAPKFAVRSDIGILQLEFVAMDGRLGGATSLLKEN